MASAAPQPHAIPAGPQEIAAALAALAPQWVPGATGVADLALLSGGASYETWALTLTGADAALIVRREPEAARTGERGIGLRAEAAAIARAAEAGVPVPRIHALLSGAEGIGEALVMDRVAGETLARRIHREPRFAPARARFAADMGAILAAIHRAPHADLPLAHLGAAATLDRLEARHRDFGTPRPVFELAFRWLRERMPAPVAPAFVHGDIRLGNILFAETGIAAVLDWELAHIGDPHEDLGWLTMLSWRFDAPLPVGGLCEREALWAAYEAAGGGPVEPRRARWWETLAALRWGIIIEEMADWVAKGIDTSVERHVIARRASETEFALLSDIAGRWH